MDNHGKVQRLVLEKHVADKGISYMQLRVFGFLHHKMAIPQMLYDALPVWCPIQLNPFPYIHTGSSKLFAEQEVALRHPLLLAKLLKAGITKETA